MKIAPIFVAFITASLLVAIGLFSYATILFSGRIAPGLQAGLHTLTGVSKNDVPTIVEAYNREVRGQVLTFILNEGKTTHSLKDLGVSLDKEAISDKIQSANLVGVISKQITIEPIPIFDDIKLNQVLGEAFADIISSPQNASLDFNAAGKLELIPSQPGEVIDITKLKESMRVAMRDTSWNQPITLSLTNASAQVQNNETSSALEYANQILKEGMELTFTDQSIPLKPFTIRRLIRFTEQIDPNNHKNLILGVKFDSEELSSYLSTTVAPAIDQPTQNARFVLKDNRVEQFSLPEQGQELNIQATASNIAAKLANHKRIAEISVNITEPVFSNIEDIANMGLTTKLATGISDYAGSPKNRVHNISVGASRYHGLLIPPGTEFSFNEFLGPVNAATGFKPELVIKSNVTTPEYGGGLCQVSTTIFRAALNSGLEITQRRNHSYAVSYYGKPGLDATIYPPYTDLRFLNNTPGYILIQTRIDGTKLAFDFWGTDDDRQVDITGPVTYDRLANGSVKAYVDQRVTLAGEVIIDETFYSRYKSPKLFPKVLAANGEISPRAGEALTVAGTNTKTSPEISALPQPKKKTNPVITTDKNNASPSPTSQTTKTPTSEASP